MSNDNSESSSSSTEDEYSPEISEEFEKSFFKTLSSLKNKDPSIYDKNNKFFDESTTVVPKEHKKKEEKGNSLFLKDYEQKCFENGEYDSENEVDNKRNQSSLPYAVEQRNLKESFKSFLNDSDDEGNDALFKPSVKSDEMKEKEETDYVQWLKGQKQELEDKNTEGKLKKLRDFWTSDDLGEDEAFLRDYILNKRFLDKDESEEEEEDDLSEDSETLEAQESYEQEYNLRFENGDGHCRRFPRNIDNSLRRKDNKRSKKRAEVKERKATEKKKKRDEINRQKKIKCKEIAERLEKLKEITGNEKLAFNDDDILNDFDPDAHDKKMSQMYNDEYYNTEDNEKPRIDDLELDDIKEEENEEDDEQVNDYDEGDPEMEQFSKKKGKKKTRTERKKERKRKKAFTDISGIEKPVYNPKLHESYQKYMDEYYQLDCEDFIDDIPCRFKYKQVVPNDFGLTIEEILAADDKELNKWSSITKIYKIRSSHVEKNEANIYKQKGQDEALKKKILPSLYKTEEEKEEKSDEEFDEKQQDVGKKKKKKSKKKKGTPNESIQNNTDELDGESRKAVEEHLPDPIENKETCSPTSTNDKKSKKKKRKRNSEGLNKETQDHSLEESKADDQNGFLELPCEDKQQEDNAEDGASKNQNSHKSQESKSNKANRKYKGGKYKKNHDFHDSRLAAYGLNPKKFKVK